MSPRGANLAEMDTPFSFWFLYKPLLHLRLRCAPTAGPGQRLLRVSRSLLQLNLKFS